MGPITNRMGERDSRDFEFIIWVSHIYIYIYIHISHIALIEFYIQYQQGCKYESDLRSSTQNVSLWKPDPAIFTRRGAKKATNSETCL